MNSSREKKRAESPEAAEGGAETSTGGRAGSNPSPPLSGSLAYKLAYKLTYKELYLLAKKELQKAELESPAFDALCLFEKVFSMGRRELALYGEEIPSQEKAEELRSLLSKRAERMPLQYLLGSWPFYGMELRVGEGVLVPREETELLVDAAAERLLLQREKGYLPETPQIADLCSGTGAVALALKGEFPQSRITAVEKFPEAYGYLLENIRATGREVIPLRADILSSKTAEGFSGLSALVSNPPYVEAGEIPRLQPEVQKEPLSALDGGNDGLRFYRAIARLWIPRLLPGGVCAVEIGENQSEAVSALFQQAGLREISILRDFSGLDRVVAGFR